MRRKICWPDPDATCLEGGCGWCEDTGESHTFTEIEAYVQQAGVLQNRGVGEKSATEAWRNGLDNGFYGRVTIKR